MGIFSFFKKKKKIEEIKEEIKENNTDIAYTPTVHIKDIVKCLDEVIDPETNMSITDQGLVYDIKILKDKIIIKMTMTTPVCPMTGYLIDTSKSAINHITDLEVDVDLVWEPRWNRLMITEEIRKKYLL